MSESVFVIEFDVESEAYQAFHELKNNPLNDDYSISQAFLVKNENGKIVKKDEFDTGIESINDTANGALIGGLVGILGGPVGMLLGSSYGILVGGTIDAVESYDNSLLINQVAAKISESQTAILMLATEKQNDSVARDLSNFTARVDEFAAADVKAEIDAAIELERQLQKEARQQMKEAKKAEREAKKAEIKEDAEAKKAELNEKAETKKAELDAKAEAKKAELDAKAEAKKAELDAKAEAHKTEMEDLKTTNLRNDLPPMHFDE